MTRAGGLLDAPGIHTPAPEAVNRRLAEGWRMVGCTSDMFHLTAGATAALAAIKRPQEDRRRRPQSSATSTAWPDWALLVTASVNSM